jgi:hypothetical protein
VNTCSAVKFVGLQIPCVHCFEPGALFAINAVMRIVGCDRVATRPILGETNEADAFDACLGRRIYWELQRDL